MQQIPQSEMMDQNPQMVQRIQPQNQIFQGNSIQQCYEIFSKFITGSRSIPLMVLIIIILISLDPILTLLASVPPYENAFIFKLKCLLPSLGRFLFAICVWSSMAVKIEKNTSTVRYGCLFIINCSLLCVMSLSFPLSPFKLWCFVLFETLLIALSNKDKKMKFFIFRIGGRAVIILSIAYNAIMNWNWNIISVVITVVYTVIYQKYVINIFGISNEKVEKFENFGFIIWIKNNVKIFVSLKDVLEKEQKNQPLVQDSNIQNPNESSFIPSKIYPNYYSQIDPNLQQMQSFPQEEEIDNLERNIINQHHQ